MAKDMRLKSNWSKDRMLNLLYVKGLCRYCGSPKGEPHFLNEDGEIYWHGFDEFVGNIEIDWQDE